MNLRILVISILFTLGALTTYAQTTAMPTATTTATTATTAANLSEYAGTYAFADGSPISTYTITVKDGNLEGDAGMGTYKLVKQPKADQYQSTSSYGSIITFVRDTATKAITGLTLAVQGQEVAAKKVK